MTNIFVSHTAEDAECAEQVRRGLEGKGYTTWREAQTLTMESILYPRTIENVILGSAVVVLIWSSGAAHSEWVERHILFAQGLKKPILPVMLDNTALHNTLIVDTTITNQSSCNDAVASLLPHLPPTGSIDPPIQLSGQAAHEHIRIRKEAIDQAAEMLQRDEHREAVLAILEYLARNDLMMGVRDKAQEVLDADAKKGTPPPSRHDESRHIFGVRCKNGHVSYFNKQRVCAEYTKLPREIVTRAGEELDELHLKCEQCGLEVVARINCKGYNK